MLDEVKQVLENQNTREDIAAMGPEAAMQLDEATKMLDDVQDGTSHNFADFMNNHPNLTGLIVWLVTVFHTIGLLGPLVGKQDKDADMEQVVKQMIREIQEETNSANNWQPDPENTDQVPAVGSKNKTKKENPYPGSTEITIDPRDEQLLNERGYYLLSLLPEFETYKRLNDNGTFGRNNDEPRCTIGYGNTWLDIRVGNTVYRYPCSNMYIPETAPLVKEIKENYKKDNRQYFIERAKLHMVAETLPALRKILKEKGMPAPEQLPDHQLAALLLAGYQMKADVISTVQRLANAKTDEAKINAFAWTWASSGNVTGTFARKYWLGLLYANKITREDLLTFPIDKFSTINRKIKGNWDTSLYMVKNSRQDIKRGKNTIHGCKFKITKQDIEENKKVVKSNSTTETLAKHLDKHGLNKNSGTKTKAKTVTEQKQQKVVKQNVDTKTEEKKSIIKGYDVENNRIIVSAEDLKESTTRTILAKAREYFDIGSYKDAIKKYEEALARNKNNAKAHSDLALAHIKYARSIESKNEQKKHYEAACAVIRAADKTNPDAKTKSNLYYNAGLAREGLADINSKDNEFDNARNQLNAAKTNYKVANKAAPSATYKQAISRIDDKLEKLTQKQKARKNKKANKKAEFYNGIENLRKLADNEATKENISFVDNGYTYDA